MLLVFLLNRGMLKRIRMLDGVMNGQCVPGYRKMLENPGNDEISRLVSSFEAMMKEIEENTEDLINHEKKEQQMQYALIVSAVDPHFIYNTLNTITFLALMDRNEDVVKVNNALIAILKNRLQAKNLQPLDRGKEEKAALKQYILIQNYLTSDRIRFSFDICADDLELRIPKNIIQPLVENAIKHGILPNKGNDGKPLVGKIQVEVFRTSDERITIKVTDNGVGMAKEVLKEYQDFCLNESDYAFDMNHIGIKNVYLRLVHLYGETVDFTIESTQGEGTSFTITIPKDAK